MTPVPPMVEACSGLAVATGLGLLAVRRTWVAMTLLAAQSAAVAAGALLGHQPLIAASVVAVDLAGATWFLTRGPGGLLHPAPGYAVFAGLALALLCQTGGVLALPLTLVLLAVLLAATRPDPAMRLVALIGLQNAIGLASGGPPALVGFALPVVAALWLWPWRRLGWMPGWPDILRQWLRVGGSAGLFAGSVAAAVWLRTTDPLASIFLPLLAGLGLARSLARSLVRSRAAFGGRPEHPVRSVLALLGDACVLVAVAMPWPAAAWLAVLAATGFGLPPPRDRGLLALCGAGLALFGLVTLDGGAPVLSCLALFVGYAAVAAALPALAIPVLVVVLRLTMQLHLPPAAGTMLILVAAGFVTAGLLMTVAAERPFRSLPAGDKTVPVAVLGGLAAMAVGLATPDGRLAGAMLLVLLILTLAASELQPAPRPGLALAGVFPGVLLALLALAARLPWTLVPVALGLLALCAVRPVSMLPPVSASLAWLPFGLALLAGFLAPDALVQWLRAATTISP